MHVSIRKFSGATDRDEVLKRVEEGLVPQIKNYPGFVAYYAIEFEDGDLGSVSVYESKELANSGWEKSIAWLQENLAELLPNEPTVYQGEALFHTVKGLGKTA